MQKYLSKSVFAALALLASTAILAPAMAEPLNLSAAPHSRASDLAMPEAAVSSALVGGQSAQLLRSSKSRVVKTAAPTLVLRNWMSSDIAAAWASGARGKGSTITVIDDFNSKSYYSGNFGTGNQSLRHGEWTKLESWMVAPMATMAVQDFTSLRAVNLARKGLNVLNLSYGMYAATGYNVGQIGWSPRESSIISAANSGLAVVAKAAGNDAVAVGSANWTGNVDYLNLALTGTQTTIFVGALDRNGAVDNQASLASYSNYAGDNQAVQRQFLSVGVRGDLTGLYGTSFAAPVVSGYAAILGSKFTTATPTQITNRLLDTARTDTIANYNASLHGRGEASLSRALAPATIN